MSTYTNSIAPDLLNELSDLKKIRKGYRQGAEPWYYSLVLHDLPAFTGFPAVINSAKLCKVSVKKYKKDPQEQSWQASSGTIRVIIPLTSGGIYYLQFSQYNNIRLMPGNVYIFSDADYKICIGKTGGKDFYLIELDCEQV